MQFWSLCKCGLSPVEGNLHGQRLRRALCAAFRVAESRQVFARLDGYPDGRRQYNVGIEFRTRNAQGQSLFRCWFQVTLWRWSNA